MAVVLTLLDAILLLVVGHEQATVATPYARAATSHADFAVEF